MEGERVRGYGAWNEDLYGVGEVLWGKRVGRGWRAEEVGGILEKFEGEEREMIKGLLEWRGGEDGNELYSGRLPWDQVATE